MANLFWLIMYQTFDSLANAMIYVCNVSVNRSFSSFRCSDLEKSVEEIQKESSVNHKLLSVQELEEKTNVLRKLGETLTELKSESCWLVSYLYTNAKLNTVGHSLKRHIIHQGTDYSSSQPVCQMFIQPHIVQCLNLLPEHSRQKQESLTLYDTFLFRSVPKPAE